VTSPTQLSMKNLAKRGYIAAVVERWNQWTKIRQDLFGFADIIAYTATTDGMRRIVLVQTTTAANMSARRKKIQESKHAHWWLLSGGDIELHGWAKMGPRGKRKVWTLKMGTFSPVDGGHIMYVGGGEHGPIGVPLHRSR